MKSNHEGSSSKSKNEDQNIDEITSLLRNISNIISKIEPQPRTVQQTVARPQTQAQFKKAPQLQILQRPSNDQQIPPPLLIDDQQLDDSTLMIIEGINNIYIHLFKMLFSLFLKNNLLKKINKNHKCVNINPSLNP